MIPARRLDGAGSLECQGRLDGESGSRAWLAMSSAWQQAAVMVVILGLTDILARLGSGATARLFFVIAGLAMGAFYLRRSCWDYLTLTFWFWTITPLARRLIDYHAGFDAVNIVLATPNLLTLFMLKDVLSSRDLLRQRESMVGLLLLLPILYGLGVSFLQGQVVSGVIAAADWLAPLLYYFYFIANWRRIDVAELPFRDFLSVNGLFVIAYGIVQYFGPLPWDVTWVIESGMDSIGKPEPYGLRVFSTLNAPGLLAIWLGTTLLLFLHFRTWMTAVLLPAGVLLLLMTLVRSVAGTLVLGLVLAGLMGRAGTFKVLGAAVIGITLVGVGMSMVDTKMANQITMRLDTLNNLGGDESAVQREALYRAAPALIGANPLGLGIGALGRGAVASNNAELVTIDSGPVAIYFALGWVAGSIYWAGIVLAMIQALLAARATRSSAALALAVAGVAGAGSLPFTGMAGFYAAIVWTCTAYPAAIAIAYQNERRTSIAIAAACHR